MSEVSQQVSSSELEAWLKPIRYNINGLAFCSSLCKRIVSKEDQQKRTSGTYQCKVDIRDCLVGPDDARITKMEGVPFTKRSVPINKTNVQRTIDTIKNSLYDPTGSLSVVSQERITKLEDWFTLVIFAVNRFKSNPADNFVIPHFELFVLEDDNTKVYREYFHQVTGKLPEEILDLLEQFQKDILIYLDWVSGTTKSVVKAEIDMEGVV